MDVARLVPHVWQHHLFSADQPDIIADSITAAMFCNLQIYRMLPEPRSGGVWL
jgi:hypothetical protein